MLKEKSKLWNKEKLEDLKKELEELRIFLNYKNSRFCKNTLDNIIEKYFGDSNEY